MSSPMQEAVSTGIALYRKGDLAEARETFGRVLKRHPDNDTALAYLGRIADRSGDLGAAERYFTSAIRGNDSRAEHYFALATVQQKLGRASEAVVNFERALELTPGFPGAHSNCAAACVALGELAKAESHCLAAIQSNPQDFMAHTNLGTVYQNRSEHDKAVECYRKALAIRPQYAHAHSNLLLCLNYGPARNPEEVFEEHKRWAARHADPLSSRSASASVDRSPRQRLRIGYISADFREHSVGYFIEPILASHNHRKFDIYCYSDVRKEDERTQRLRARASSWHPIQGLSDQDVAELVGRHKIDILVDLAGHTARNRLLVFARHPAPVQITYLGYPNTTGLSTIDYRLTDAVADPPGSEGLYTEELVRLQPGFLCYLPSPAAPGPGPLPADQTGYVTFGSFNNFPKVTDEVLELWGQVLNRVERSRIVLKSRQLRDATVRRRVRDALTKWGIDHGRVELHGPIPSVSGHLALYGRIDIGLDTFPYNGTTTTCEALCMGVPVISLAGISHAGRVGMSILSQVGLPSLVARDKQHYLDLAAYLAGDRDRLRKLRAGLRPALLSSPLCDAAGFTRQLESTYRSLWERQ